MIQIINGDIFDAFNQGCDAICHQVNCQGVMGAGLAKEIAKRYPEVKRDYQELCMEEPSDKLLGTYIDTPVEGGHVISIFGQEHYGRDLKRCYTSYAALDRAFRLIHECLHAKKIAFPYGMGCGLGGGSWDVVFQLIVNEFNHAGEGPDVVIFRKEL